MLSLSSIAGLLSRAGCCGRGRPCRHRWGRAASAGAERPVASEILNPNGMAKPAGYTHVVEMTGPGRTIYIAGQLGYDATGKRAASRAISARRRLRLSKI